MQFPIMGACTARKEMIVYSHGNISCHRGCQTLQSTRVNQATIHHDTTSTYGDPLIGNQSLSREPMRMSIVTALP